MLPLKFYHDFNCEIESYSYAFGPCWEPVIAQCNLAMEKILPPSRDPSPPLSFWDKMRLLLHGRLTMVVKQLTVLLHASLDPYNTTEEMELTWNQVIMDWTNGRNMIQNKIIANGNLQCFKMKLIEVILNKRFFLTCLKQVSIIFEVFKHQIFIYHLYLYIYLFNNT